MAIELSEKGKEARRRYYRERARSKKGKEAAVRYWDHMAERYEAQDKLAEVSKRQPRTREEA